MTLSNVQKSIDSIFDEMSRVALQILADNESKILCQMEQSSRISYKKKDLIDSLQETFGFVLITYNYIESIHMYSEYNKYVVAPNSGGNIDNMKQLAWINNISRDELDNSWHIIEVDNRLKMVYSLGIKYDQKNYTWVFINIDANNLINSIVNSEHDYFNFIIVGEDNTAIYDNFDKITTINIYEAFPRIV